MLTFSRIRTQIVGEEGKHADQLTRAFGYYKVLNENCL